MEELASTIMSKSHKKTVSFSEESSPPPEVHEDEHQIVFQRSLKAIPFHLILIIFSILHNPIVPALDLQNNLQLHLIYLVGSQLIYSSVLISNVSEKHRKKSKQLKLRVKDYNIVIIAVLISIVLIGPVYIALVLFGAPFTTYIKETALLAGHIVYLSFPIVILNLKLGNANTNTIKILIPIAVSAWLSAVVIPLDWDRDWQNWPLPIVVGAYTGAIIGYSFSSFI